MRLTTTFARGLWVSILLLLVGCARLQPLPADWQLDQREQALLAIDHWRFDGKLGVKAPSDSGSVYVGWSQRAEAYAIQMQGPLGQGGGTLVGGPSGVRLQQGDRELAAPTASALVRDAFGWELPMSALPFWVRGLPAPDLKQRQSIERDAQGLLTKQYQDGWVLEYSQYKLVQGHALPGKLKAESKALGLRLVLVISDWKLGAES